MNDDTFIPLDEAARVVFPGGHITGATLKRKIRKGELKAYSIGKSYLTTLRDVRAMAAASEVVPSNPAPQPPGLGLDSMELARLNLESTLARLSAKPRGKM